MTRLKGEKMKKSLISLILAALFAFSALSCHAVDIEYDGEVSAEEGENESGNEKTKTRVDIGDGTLFDTKTGRYIYKIGETEVSINYPRDAIVTSDVQFTVSGGTAYSVYLDGKEITKPSGNSVSEPGGYVIVVSNNDEEAIRFTIAGKKTGKLYSYKVPENFEIVSASLDGKDIKPSNNSVDMDKEGEYVINYRCIKTEENYNVDIIVDHTAPTLALKEVVDGHASGPVDISDLERGAKIKVYVDGTLINAKDKLEQSGLYNILIEDEAGNQNDYSFRIDIYFNFDAIAFIVIIVLLLIALTVYLVLSRKKLRIR